MVAVAGLVVLLLTVLALVIPVTMLANAGLTLPGENERRVRSLDRQWEIIREVERGLPLYPGSQRIREEHETIAHGSARALIVCWSAPAQLDTIRRYFAEYLGTRSNGWAPVGGAYRKGRVHLEIGACEGTYELTFRYVL